MYLLIYQRAEDLVDTLESHPHSVSTGEAEQVFFNLPLVVERDIKHSIDESRFFALGESDAGRRLFVVLPRYTSETGTWRRMLAT